MSLHSLLRDVEIAVICLVIWGAFLFLEWLERYHRQAYRILILAVILMWLEIWNHPDWRYR